MRNAAGLPTWWPVVLLTGESPFISRRWVMGWTLHGFDRLADQLAPRDNSAWAAWLNRLADDPHTAGTPHDHSTLWQAAGLDCAVCSYEIDDKLGVVTLISFHADKDAWQAEDG